MKTKIIAAIALVALFLYSCGGSKSTATSTSTAPVVAEKKAETPTSTAVAEGKGLYENNCAKCHKLYDASDFSAEEWKPIVLRMQKKAHLTEEQGNSIYNYLTAK